MCTKNLLVSLLWERTLTLQPSGYGLMLTSASAMWSDRRRRNTSLAAAFCTDKIGQEAGQPVCHCHSAVDRGPKQQQLQLDDDSRDEMADAAKLTQCCEAAWRRQTHASVHVWIDKDMLMPSYHLNSCGLWVLYTRSVKWVGEHGITLPKLVPTAGATWEHNIAQQENVSERAKCLTTSPSNLPTWHIGVLATQGVQ